MGVCTEIFRRSSSVPAIRCTKSLAEPRHRGGALGGPLLSRRGQGFGGEEELGGRSVAGRFGLVLVGYGSGVCYGGGERFEKKEGGGK